MTTKPPAKVEDPLWRFFDPVWLFTCEVCREPSVFFIRILGGRLACAECWHAVGAPFPRRIASDSEKFEREQATRERMKARGGTSRHLVNAGKA